MQDSQIAGNPLGSSIPSIHSNIVYGRANSPGYGKNLKNWAIRSQAPPHLFIINEKWCAVHRLNGCRYFYINVKMLKI